MKTQHYPHRRGAYARLVDDLTKAATRREERRERASASAMRKATAGLELALRPITSAAQVAARRRQVTSLMRKAQAAYQSGAITGEQLVAYEARRHQVVQTLASRGLI